MRYHLVLVRTGGYSRRDTFTADSLLDACERHVKAWANRGSAFAMVMRDENGKRYSKASSEALLSAAMAPASA